MDISQAYLLICLRLRVHLGICTKVKLLDIRELFNTGRLTSKTHVKTGVTVLLPLVALSLIVVAMIPNESTEPSPIAPLLQDPVTVFPDFTEIVDVDDKKRQFLDYLEGFIVTENEEIAVIRSRLLFLAEIVGRGDNLSLAEAHEIITLSEIYRVEYDGLSTQYVVDELIQRIDHIPVSLALAQAANESAWGTSRFTIEGNNVFGQWCYEEGCGMVPSRRVSGARHEVEYFDTVEKSVKSYFLNINTHDSYAYLRDLRLKMRERGLKLDPMSLSIGLGRYSERGAGYVDEIQRIIIQNELRDRDIPPS